jgi:S1-C subfamily serine protease
MQQTGLVVGVLVAWLMGQAPAGEPAEKAGEPAEKAVVPPARPMPGEGFLGVRFNPNAVDLVEVIGVDPNTAAANAGVLPGDKILRLGELRAVNPTNMTAYVRGLQPGTEISLVVLRAGRTVRLRAVLGTRPMLNEED